MVGGLLDVILARKVAFHVSGLGHQRVASRTGLRTIQMRAVHDVLIGRVQLHRRLQKWGVVLSRTVRTVDGQGIKLQLPAERIAHRGGLLVACHTTDAIQRQAVLEQLRHRVMFLPQMMGIEMSQRRVA